jgi:hypothetical protein
LAFVLRYGSSSVPVPDRLDAEAALTAAQSFRREWIDHFDNARTRSLAAMR